MVKSEIIKAVSAKIEDLSEEDVFNSVNKIFNLINDGIVSGRRVEIRDFGCFCQRFRKSRRAHNPKTGQAIITEQKYITRFKAGRELAARVNENKDKSNIEG